MGLLSVIKEAASGLVAPALNLVDELHTSDEEKMVMKSQLMKLQQDFELKMFEAENRRMEIVQAASLSQHQLMIAETKSESWITKSWRPIAGLGFVLLLFLVFGKPALQGKAASVQLPDLFWYAMLSILGVAFGGRSFEKRRKTQALEAVVTKLPLYDRGDTHVYNQIESPGGKVGLAG